MQECLENDNESAHINHNQDDPATNATDDPATNATDETLLEPEIIKESNNDESSQEPASNTHIDSIINRRSKRQTSLTSFFHEKTKTVNEDFLDSDDEFSLLETDEDDEDESMNSDEDDIFEIEFETLDLDSEDQEISSSADETNNDNPIDDDDDLLSPADRAWIHIEKILKNYKWNKDEISRAYDGFFFWLTKSNEELRIANDSDDDSCWSFIRARKIFSKLAELRDIIATIPASEAACERAFSFLKKIITPIANNTSEEVEMAKIIYMTTDKYLEAD